MTLHLDMPQYQDFTKLNRFALKYIKVILRLNAERKLRAQPFRLVQEDQHGDEDEDDQGDLQDLVDGGGDCVDIPKFGDMEIGPESRSLHLCEHRATSLPTTEPHQDVLSEHLAVEVVQLRVGQHGARFLPEAAPISRV